MTRNNYTFFPANPKRNPMKKLGRNDKCDCGCGKKVKICKRDTQIEAENEAEAEKKREYRNFVLDGQASQRARELARLRMAGLAGFAAFAQYR